ncbi:MAG: protein-export chaperone SecB [Pseudomonadota bacterium]|nr:protein-export chaperone SecB [Pseudomonadota bacterium]
MTVNPALAIQKIYIRSLSSEVPAYHLLPKAVHQPKIDIEIDTGGGAFVGGMYEATLSLTVRATQNGKHLFLVVLKQGGLFSLTGIQPSDIEHVLKHSCAAILYPYARKNIAVAILNSGFQPVILNHIPFDATYKSRFGMAAETPSPPPTPLEPDTAVVPASLPAGRLEAGATAAEPAISLPPPVGRRAEKRSAFRRLSLSVMALTLIGIPLAYWALQPASSPPPAVQSGPAPVDPTVATVEKLAAAGAAWLADQEGYVVQTRPLVNAGGVLGMEHLRVAAPLHVIREKSGSGYLVIAGAYPSRAEADHAARELTAQGIEVETHSLAGMP